MLLLLIVGGFVGGGLVFVVLHLMPPFIRRWLIAVVTFFAGLFFILEFMIPKENFLSDFKESYTNAWAVIAAFALGLGIINLLTVHIKNIRDRKPGWYNSVALVAGLVGMIVIGLWQTYVPTHIAIKKVYDVMFFNIMVPLQNTMFSLLAFYMVSAAYRAFRVRTAEAGLLMVVAFIVLLGQVPIGAWLTEAFPRTTHWLLTSFNMAAFRGINFGAAIGGIAMSIRILLSLERGAFFEQKL